MNRPFLSEDGRFPLRLVRQGEMGNGLSVWPNSSVPPDTRLLAFDIIEVCENVKEFELYCDAHDQSQVWSLKLGRRYYVYDHTSSSAHLVNQLPRSKCNLVLKHPKDLKQRRIFLNSGARPIKGGTPLGVRYNSVTINKTIAAESKLRDQRRFCERLRSSSHTRTSPARTAKQDNKRMRHERARKGALASAAARARGPVVYRGPCGCCLM